MARVETIIVGGGIGASTPFTLNHFLFVGNVDPALAASSVQMVQVLAPGNPGIIISPTGADPNAAATEALRVSGGIISLGTGTDSVVLGRAASVDAGGTRSIAIGLSAAAGTGVGSIVIGGNATKTAAQAGDVVIGDGASTAGGSGVCIGNASSISAGGSAVSVCIGGTIAQAGGGHVCIGGSIPVVGGAVSGCVVIGGSATVTNDRMVVIGKSASGAGTTGVAIGMNAQVDGTSGVAVGFGAKANSGGAISIGSGATSFQANTLVFGGTGGAQITTIVMGRGDTGTVDNILYRQTNATGADAAGGKVTLQAGLGTGNATAGQLALTTGDQVTGSSSTLQTATDKLLIYGTSALTGFRFLSPGTRDTLIELFQAGAQTGVMFSPGVAGNIITGSALGDLGFRVSNKKVIFSADAGNTIDLAVSHSVTATETSLQIFDVDNATLERVTVGAAGSGGVGFKLLRIPN